MLFTYIWHYQALSSSDAQQKFSALLTRQSDIYEKAWGHAPAIHTEHIGNTLVGQLSYDTGIKNWANWVNRKHGGIAWGGICETYLGNRYTDQTVSTVINTLKKHPEQLIDWEGRFSVTSWDRGTKTVCLTTGAVESPTLWFTEGPFGWAVGSRATPILGMVGRPTELSHAAANLYLAYGYLVGSSSLFKGVSRLPSRQQVQFKESEKPRAFRYLSAADLFSETGAASRRDDMVQNCASALNTRVKRQIKYSSKPKLLITGGRDSRAIAAAAKSAGYAGPVSTGGSVDSADFRIGKQVTDILGMEHGHSSNRATIQSIVNAEGSLLLWTEMSEGIETLRHALAYPDFFQRNLSFADTFRQNFHGLGGEIGRGFYYPRQADPEKLKVHNREYAHRIIGKLADENIWLSQEARDARDEILFGIDTELEDLQPTVAQWLDFYYWQNRCLHWGSDMLSVKSPMFHAWTPHMNLRYVRSAWQLPVEDKANSQFSEDIIDVLAPGLSQLKFDHEIPMPSRPALRNRLKTATKNTIKGFLPAKPGSNDNTDLHATEREFWNKILLHSQQQSWAAFLTGKDLEHLINGQPDSAILWNLATTELVKHQ